MPTVSETLKTARIAAGMTVREAAGLVNCAHPWIVQLETGTRSVSSANARRLAEAYGIPADDLVMRAEEERRTRMKVRRDRMREADAALVDVTGLTDAEIVARVSRGVGQ
jgi:transcriptional regulator with XRE-family HTH domain